MADLAYNYHDDVAEELINGEIVLMSPRPGFNHMNISSNIHGIFNSYLRKKTCKVFFEMEVRLTDKDRFIPDVLVVCDRNKIKKHGIEGAPDLVVEVLSPSTGKNDRFYKKDVYGKCGVKEYWLVEPGGMSIEVYLQRNGVLEPEEFYAVLPDYQAEDMRAKGKEIITEFKTSLFDDLVISIDEVFEDLIKE